MSKISTIRLQRIRDYKIRVCGKDSISLSKTWDGNNYENIYLKVDTAHAVIHMVANSMKILPITF